MPDLPTFAVDDGFAYAVPEGIDATTGSIVRVPLGGRRVRGWVVAEGEPEREGLRAVLGVSGEHPVFDASLLTTLRWAAVHYVAPVAAVLAKAGPPNLPKGKPSPPSGAVVDGGPDPVPGIAGAIRSGRHARTHLWVGLGPDGGDLAAVVRPALARERSALVVAPTVLESEVIATRLESVFPGRVATTSSAVESAAATRTWVAAATSPGRVLVGTREAAFRPVADLAVAVVVGEGRRGMKDKATPTTHARDVLWRRSGVERFPLLLADLVPTTDALVRGPVVVPGRPGRPWGLVEVVDRGDDPPGSGILSVQLRRALASVAASRQRAFVFTHRRSAATRCVRCRTLRRCPGCGALPGRADVCPRCGAGLAACAECGGRRFEPLGADVPRLVAEVGGVAGRDIVGEVGSGRRIEVGTERDLPSIDAVDLAVVVDADGLLMAANYRAAEDGLRILARVVATAGPGRGRRAIVQTADPGQAAIVALRRAEPLPFLAAEVEERRSLGLPPAGEILVLEVGGASGSVAASLTEAVAGRAEVHGPAEHRGAQRWLIQSRDLRAVRVALRGLVQELRDGGARVRVDADPMDL